MDNGLLLLYDFENTYLLTPCRAISHTSTQRVFLCDIVFRCGSNFRQVKKEFDDKGGYPPAVTARVLSEKVYAQGPWSMGGSPLKMRDGYLFYRPNYEGKSSIYLMKYDGETIKVLQDYGLNGGLSISPDGCKAAYVQRQYDSDWAPRNLAVIDFCN